MDAPASGAEPPAAGARRLEPEIMDDPELDTELHRAALAGLARINRLSLAARPLWRALAPAARSSRSLRLLDVATGGGDVAVALALRARGQGCDLAITGLDRSRLALELAAGRAAAAGVKLMPVRVDVLAGALPEGHDVVMSSLFFHHLERPAAVDLLARMAAAGRRLLVEDLRRSAFGTLLAATVPRLLTRSPVVHVDALRSARAAFRPCELLAIAGDAGVTGARVETHWPARMLLVADTDS